MPSVKDFFTAEQVKQVESAIRAAEESTSGEIRVHLEKGCLSDPVPCAAAMFKKLKMHKTKLGNGILFYLAVQDRKFAVIGDAGIHKCVPAGFWDLVRDKMLVLFKEEKFTEGLCEGITMTGIELKKYFPLSASDKNELSNEVTFGEK